MTDTRTYLTRMTLFLVVVGIGVALISRTLLGIFLVNPLLNGVILAVIVLGIVLNFRQVILLGPEARWLDRFHTGMPGQAPGEPLTDTGFNELRNEAPKENL